MIFTSQLSKQYGPKVLFEEVTLELLPGHRYGLVGANGSGKSTFLRILMGDEHADHGELTFGKKVRLGVLRQDQFAHDDERILDVAMQGDRAVYEALGELTRSETNPNFDASRFAELSDLLAREDGYTLETRAREILVGLGIPSGRLELPLSTLSGGYKLRVLLAQVLVGRPEVLLLDEPTNHLDILSIRWLEQFLGQFAGCAVVISHDRRFLDSISTRVLDVDYGTITDYPGNYTKFLATKELRKEQRDAEIARTEKIIAEKKAFIERFGAKATKAKQAQSRMKQLEKIEVSEAQTSSRRAPFFRFDQERPTGKDVLSVEGLAKAYGEKKVLEGVSFSVRRGERVAIIGENGIGKSTLLKILTGNAKADAGRFEFGVHAKLGYFAQDHHDLLSDPNLTPLEFVWSAVPGEPTTVVRGQLGKMLFSGDEVEKKVTTLSGGEAARVVFARLIIEKPNVLVLDEPTNHLDLESIDALAETLEKYEGTLLFVSHDRWFVSKVATRIIELRKDGMTDFPGTFDEYLSRAGEDHLDAAQVSLRAKAEKLASAAEKPKEDGLSYEERKRLTNRRKTLPKKRDEVLADVETLEERKASLLARYAEDGFFERTSAEDLRKLEAEQTFLDGEIQSKMTLWEELEKELAELDALVGPSTSA